MCEMDSPLFPYYPLDFKIDLNDKKREWEAVVLLPFIDLQLLLQSEAMQCPPALLNPEEQQRNRFGNSYVFRIDSSAALSVTVIEFPPDIHPSPTAFEPYLPIGTLPSLPGFPTLSKVVVTKGNAKKSDSVSETFNSKKERRQRNLAARSNLVAISADSQFPMLGDPGKQTWATSGARDDVPHLGIRFLLNDDVNVFLFDMVEQIRLQSPHVFRSDFNLSESTSLPPLSLKGPVEYSPGIYGIDYSIKDNIHSISPQLVDGVIGKVCDIFGTVRGKLLPFCSVDIPTGLVSIHFQDVSHLSQIEYFLSNKLSTMCFPDGNGHVNGSGSGSECIQSNRKIVIGRYTGSEAGAFESWLNTEVSTIALYLPLFTSRILEVYISSSNDGSQVKQYVLYGREN